MTLRYTTLENITRRLSPRVAVGTDVSFGQNAVNADLITEQIGPQVEAKIDRTMVECGVASKVNGVVVTTVDPIVLQSVAEKLICCDILTTYFVGSETSDDPYAKIMCDTGANELSALCGSDRTGEVSSFSRSARRNVPTNRAAMEDIKW